MQQCSNFILKIKGNSQEKYHKETIINEEFEYSGYYLYDLQFLRLNEVKHYKLTLYYAILNIPSQKELYPQNTKKY